MSFFNRKGYNAHAAKVCGSEYLDVAIRGTGDQQEPGCMPGFSRGCGHHPGDGSS